MKYQQNKKSVHYLQFNKKTIVKEKLITKLQTKKIEIENHSLSIQMFNTNRAES